MGIKYNHAEMFAVSLKLAEVCWGEEKNFCRFPTNTYNKKSSRVLNGKEFEKYDTGI